MSAEQKNKFKTALVKSILKFKLTTTIYHNMVNSIFISNDNDENITVKNNVFIYSSLSSKKFSNSLFDTIIQQHQMTNPNETLFHVRYLDRNSKMVEKYLQEQKTDSKFNNTNTSNTLTSSMKKYLKHTVLNTSNKIICGDITLTVLSYNQEDELISSNIGSCIKLEYVNGFTKQKNIELHYFTNTVKIDIEELKLFMKTLAVKKFTTVNESERKDILDPILTMLTERNVFCNSSNVSYYKKF